MAKLNVSTEQKAVARALKRTFEGGVAYEKTPRIELYQLVATCMLGEPTFYEGADARRARIDKLVDTIVSDGGARFVANLAVYTRSEMQLRTVSVYLTVSLARALRAASDQIQAQARKDQLVRRAVAGTIQRADELREVFAGAISVFGEAKAVPRAIKDGVADAFEKFNEYGFAKYSGGQGSVKLLDALRLAHPVPKDEERSVLYKKIVDGTLATPDTWEVRISAEGQKDTPDYKAAWTEVLPAMKYMGLLRNLRNLKKHGLLDRGTDTRTSILSRISDPESVRRSRQLPFRFLSAYEMLQADGADTHILAAIDDAFEVSCENVPDLGNCMIFTDTSGSMQAPLSGKSKMTYVGAGAALSAILWRSQVKLGHDVAAYAFASTAMKFTPSARQTAMGFMNEICKSIGKVGHGTELAPALRLAESEVFAPDVIFVISDCQTADDMVPFVQTGKRLRRKNPIIFSLNVAGYATTSMSEKNGIYQLGGFSSKVFEMAEALRSPGDAVRLIEEREL